jgi:hypothetical protein
MVSIDFFAVPTAKFRILVVQVILSHSRRRLVHFNVTANPTANWTAQQIILYRLIILTKPGMRLFEVFGYWNSLRAFFFTFKALDTVIGLFLFWEIPIMEARGPGIVVDKGIVIIH